MNASLWTDKHFGMESKRDVGISLTKSACICQITEDKVLRPYIWKLSRNGSMTDASMLQETLCPEMSLIGFRSIHNTERHDKIHHTIPLLRERFASVDTISSPFEARNRPLQFDYAGCQVSEVTPTI
jgi:hypothetical protein